MEHLFYLLNVSPIDDTNIIRSTPVIGMVLHLSLNFDECLLPTPIGNPTQSIIEYIKYLGREVNFSRELLVLITED